MRMPKDITGRRKLSYGEQKKSEFSMNASSSGKVEMSFFQRTPKIKISQRQ